MLIPDDPIDYGMYLDVHSWKMQTGKKQQIVQTRGQKKPRD